ncbi:hypothetical protein PI126_g955 [Phytophthora idaei]|nr:hypothetical protein PI126_g955 [Phytophthora idaei]
MGVQCRDDQPYHEVASYLEGEAKRWFETVIESVSPEEENINTSAGIPRKKYMKQRSGPESLREISERGEIGDVWQVNAFLKGMSSPMGATHVRGHLPRTLDEALNVAIPQVGEYGEGYGVGMGAVITAWDTRETTVGRGPLAAISATAEDKEQSGLGGNLYRIRPGVGHGTEAATRRVCEEGAEAVGNGKESVEQSVDLDNRNLVKAEVAELVVAHLSVWVACGEDGYTNDAGNEAPVTLEALQADVEAETLLKDAPKVKVFLQKARQALHDEVVAQGDEHQRRRRKKREERRRRVKQSGKDDEERRGRRDRWCRGVDDPHGDRPSQGRDGCNGRDEYRPTASVENSSEVRQIETTYVRFEVMWRKATKDGVGMLIKDQADAIGYMPPTARVVTAKKLPERQRVPGFGFDYVEEFTGAVARVLGVRRFRFQTPYGQDMTVDALVVEGAADEFLLGEDWMMRNGVKIDFTSCEMKWYDGDDKKIVPFSCTTNWQLIDDRTVRMRLVRTAKVVTSTCRRLELAVAPPEGTMGLFMPARRVEPHLLLAPTLTTVRDGKVAVPVMNLVGHATKLPTKESLGTWAPTTDDMQVLDVSGGLMNAKVW